MIFEINLIKQIYFKNHQYVRVATKGHTESSFLIVSDLGIKDTNSLNGF